MKYVLLFLIALMLYSSESTKNQDAPTLKISFSDLDSLRKEFGNNTVSFKDLIWALMENIPIPSIGSPRDKVDEVARKAGLEIVYSDSHKLVVRGSSDKKSKSDGKKIFISEGSYIYSFKNDLLYSGPNFLSDG